MKKITGLIFAGLAAASLSGEAHACACCADSGQRTLSTEAIDGYVGEEFKRVRWSAIAQPFLSPCDECVQGIKALSDSYQIGVFWTDKGLEFRMIGDEPGAKGTLLLATPKEITVFSTDRTPGDRDGMVVLYKEWRVTVPIKGTGAFSAVTGEGHLAELVLHGTGNSCEMADGMTHWSLGVKGPDVDFRFYGRLNNPE